MKASSDTSKPRKCRILVLEGTPYNRGLTHGKAVKEEIHDLVQLWKTDLKNRFNTDPDLFIKEFVQKTDYVSAIRKWTPDLLDEIKGLAEGTGLDLDTILVFQYADEYYTSGEGVAMEHCSCLGLNREGNEPAYVAQNMDLEIFRDGFQVVLHIRHPDSDIESFVLSCAGMIALNGMNNRSIGICCNAVHQLNSCRDGLPVACVVRGVLQQKTEKDAVAFLKRIKHASGENYVLGGPDHVYSFECSAEKVERYRPDSRDMAVWHTNHPLVNRDYSTRYRTRLADKAKNEVEENSVVRLENLRRRLSGETAGPCLDMIKATLASKDSALHPICCSRGRDEFPTKMGWFTFATTIMVLSGHPEFHITFGPSDLEPYQKLSFSPGAG